MKPSQFFTDTSSLDLIESDCWKLLTKASTDAKSDFKLPILASAATAGVSQRIVVLRSVDAETGSLLIHTDVRSAKIQQLRQNPVASLLFYDKAKKVQLTATALATIHTDDAIADQLWQSESATSIKCYLGPLPPGTVCSEPTHNLHPELLATIPDRSQLQAARPNFAAVRFVVTQFDWLQLNRSGNLHAQFTYADDRSITGTWTAP